MYEHARLKPISDSLLAGIRSYAPASDARADNGLKPSRAHQYKASSHHARQRMPATGNDESSELATASCLITGIA